MMIKLVIEQPSSYHKWAWCQNLFSLCIAVIVKLFLIVNNVKSIIVQGVEKD